MPIVHFCRENEVPAHAVNVRPMHRGEDLAGYVLYDTHVGLCLEDRERNGYHDSDFYMIVWNPEKAEPESIEFATTRFWTYPCMASHVDATPEVRALYEAWQERKETERVIGLLQARRAKGREIRSECGLTWPEFKRLRDAVGCRGGREEIPEGYVKLLRSEHAGRLRSGFRKSLAAQVRKWLADPSSPYATPLSAKQARYLFVD